MTTFLISSTAICISLVFTIGLIVPTGIFTGWDVLCYLSQLNTKGFHIQGTSYLGSQWFNPTLLCKNQEKEGNRNLKFPFPMNIGRIKRWKQEMKKDPWKDKIGTLWGLPGLFITNPFLKCSLLLKIKPHSEKLKEIHTLWGTRWSFIHKILSLQDIIKVLNKWRT